MTEKVPLPDYLSDTKAYVALEQQHLSGSKRNKKYWAGIALSGGGVRSASFCLGVLQALAAKNLLGGFDYISTVSGGGFIGGALQWWLSGGQLKQGFKFGVDRDSFPYGSKHPDFTKHNQGVLDQNQEENLKYLQQHISYLTPGDGISYQSGFIAILRTVFLNLAVWFPIVTFAFVLLVSLSLHVAKAFAWLPGPLSGFEVWTPDASWHDWPKRSQIPVLFVLTMWLVWSTLVIMALAFVAYALTVASTKEKERKGLLAPNNRKKFRIVGIILGVVGLIVAYRLRANIFGQNLQFISAVAIFGCILIGLVALLDTVVIYLRPTDVSANYTFRRGLEVIGGGFVFPILGFAFVGAIPIVHNILREYSITSSLIGVGWGIVSALYAHFSAARSLAPNLAVRLFANIGSVLFLFGFCLLSYNVALTYVLSGSALFTALGILALSVAGTSASFTNLNQVGLHRYYRDRIMEAFMPSATAVKDGASTYSPKADHQPLAKLDKSAIKGLGPYPIINTNVILTQDKNRKHRARGGASFSFTPLYVGSEATGWAQTASYKNRQGDIQLASAVATSGAAANSNAGYTGLGITRDRLVSLVMMLLNVRLGLWLGNPNPNAGSKKAPTHIFPGLPYAIFGYGYASDSGFVELSDGGHFENLGIYELARRHVRLIVVCDGEADKEISYAGLLSATRRIHEDFQAVINFLEPNAPSSLVPRKELGYPSGANAAESPYVLATITYPDGPVGLIIYAKATVIEELSFLTLGYKGKNPDFPHQTTVDQFFKLDQFESYRELGYVSATRFIEELALSNMPDEPFDLLKQGIFQKEQPPIKGKRLAQTSKLSSRKER